MHRMGLELLTPAKAGTLELLVIEERLLNGLFLNTLMVLCFVPILILKSYGSTVTLASIA